MNDTELEDQLTALFDRRAADVRSAASIDFSPFGPGQTRLSLAPFAIAASVAAVVLVAGGSVVGIRSLHHPASSNSAATHSVAPSPAPSSRSTSCQPVHGGTSWQAPIDNGRKVALDHPDNRVVSVNASTGEYLLLQSRPSSAQSAALFGQASLAIFRGGTGLDVAVLAPGSTDVPMVDPAGAISGQAIAYGLAHPQNAGTYYQVMLYDRHSRATTTIDQLTDSELMSGTIFSGPPVIFGHVLYWIQSVYSDRSKSVLKSYDLQTAHRESTPVPGAISLVFYGTGLATVAGYDTDSAFVTRVGAQLSGNSVTAIQGASAYAFNAPAPGTGGAGSLGWVKTTTVQGKTSTRYYQLPDVSTAGLSYYDASQYAFDLGVGTGPFVPVTTTGAAAAPRVLDLRSASEQLQQLPTGDELQAVVGDTAIFGAGSSKSGASGLVLVKLASLPQQTAGC